MSPRSCRRPPHYRPSPQLVLSCTLHAALHTACSLFLPFSSGSPPLIPPSLPASVPPSQTDRRHPAPRLMQISLSPAPCPPQPQTGYNPCPPARGWAGLKAKGSERVREKKSRHTHAHRSRTLRKKQDSALQEKILVQPIGSPLPTWVASFVQVVCLSYGKYLGMSEIYACWSGAGVR